MTQLKWDGGSTTLLLILATYVQVVKPYPSN